MREKAGQEAKLEKAVIYDGMADRKTRRAYTERSNGIGESLDLWDGMLGQREVTFEQARILFAIEKMLILF